MDDGVAKKDSMLYGGRILDLIRAWVRLMRGWSKRGQAQKM